VVQEFIPPGHRPVFPPPLHATSFCGAGEPGSRSPRQLSCFYRGIGLYTTLSRGETPEPRHMLHSGGLPAETGVNPDRSRK